MIVLSRPFSLVEGVGGKHVPRSAQFQELSPRTNIFACNNGKLIWISYFLESSVFTFDIICVVTQYPTLLV
jgi:hypothetical protein